MTNRISVIFSNRTNNSDMVENILIIGINDRRDLALYSLLKKENYPQSYLITSRDLLSAPYTTVMELYDSWHRPTDKGGFLIKPDAMPFFLQPDATSLLLHFYRTARPHGKKIIAVADRFEDIPKKIIEYIPNIICLDEKSRECVSRQIPTASDERVFAADEEQGPYCDPWQM